ncbi:MAG: hypothetical protein DCC67_05345 [Planctomycetota bacterium]|nr:MAG: hypothetical protein DCC67_05345 [Planctomycetota bacterium]
MSSLLHSISGIPAPFNMIVWVVLICSFAGIVTAAFKEIRKFACHRQELEFKRELVDRGMSADEIERVVRSRSESKVS